MQNDATRSNGCSKCIFPSPRAARVIKCVKIRDGRFSNMPFWQPLVIEIWQPKRQNLYLVRYSSRPGAMAIPRAILYGTLQRGQMLTSHYDWNMSRSTRRANQPSQRRSMSLASAKRLAPSTSSKPTQVATLVWNVLVGLCLPLARAKLQRAVKWEVANGPMNAHPAILIGVPPLHLRDPNQPTRRNSTRVVHPVRQRCARANPIGVQDRCLRHSSASLDQTSGAVPKLHGVLVGVPNAAV